MLPWKPHFVRQVAQNFDFFSLFLIVDKVNFKGLKFDIILISDDHWFRHTF